jgi:hypothetical protein
MIKLFYSQSAQSSHVYQCENSRMRATYNQGADSSESSDALAGAVVELDLDDILLGVREADRQVAERLCELAL